MKHLFESFLDQVFLLKFVDKTWRYTLNITRCVSMVLLQPIIESVEL